jgi:hypothetical protein
MNQNGWIVLLSVIACIGAVAVYARISTANSPSSWTAGAAMHTSAEGGEGVAADRSATMRTPVPDDWSPPDERKRLSFLQADGTPAVGLAVVVGRLASPQLHATAQSGLPRRILADSKGEVLLDADLDPGEALTVVMSEWVELQGKLADWCRTPRIVLPHLAGLTVWIAPRLTNSELRLCRLSIERVGGEVEVPTIPGVRVQTATRTLPVPDTQELRVSGLLADFEYKVGIECPERLVAAEPLRMRPPEEASLTVQRAAALTLRFLGGESGHCLIYSAADKSAGRYPAARAVRGGECLVPLGALEREQTYFLEAIGPGWASVDGHSFVTPGVATVMEIPTNSCRAVRIEFRGLDGESAIGVTTVGGQLQSDPDRDSGDGAGAIVSSEGETWWVTKNPNDQGPLYYFVHPSTLQVVPCSFANVQETVVVEFSRSEIRVWREGLDFARRHVTPSMTGAIFIEVSLPGDPLFPWWPSNGTSLKYGWNNEEWWKLGFGAGQRYRLHIIDNRSGSRIEFVSNP